MINAILSCLWCVFFVLLVETLFFESQRNVLEGGGRWGGGVREMSREGKDVKPGKRKEQRSEEKQRQAKTEETRGKHRARERKRRVEC